MSGKTVEGGCLCRNVRYRVDGSPVWIGYCHCRSCRRSTGAAAVTHVGVRDTDLTFVKGNRKIFESSPGVNRGFCSECGSPLTYEADRFPAYVQVYVGTFDRPNQFLPQAHVHFSERVSWFNVNDELPRYAGSVPWCTTRDVGSQLSSTRGFEVPDEQFQTHSAEICEQDLSR